MPPATGDRETVIAANPVPLAAPGRSWLALQGDLQAAFDRVMRAGSFILGHEVRTLEDEYAAFCGVSDAVATASGTDALMLALSALEVTGRDVITSAISSSATATAIVRAGARPVFVDIAPTSANIDADKVAAHITPQVRALVPVHLYGRPAEMGYLLRLAADHGLAVIEDACQAHGAEWGGKRVGSLGTAGCFSFYPTKNLGAFGDGGMITTNDPGLAERLRLLRQYGWRERDRSESLGVNSRLDELQAAFLRAKLPHLDGWNQRRREIAGRYEQGLDRVADLQLPDRVTGHAFHVYPVRSRRRDLLKRRLADRGILTGVHYPVPLHRQPAFSPYSPGVLPNADALAAETLSLPMFPELSDAEVDRVVETVVEVAGR